MSIVFESDSKVSATQLVLRGIAFIAVLAVAVSLLLIKAQGGFEKSVRVTAALFNVGDGLPGKSDVKYQGVVVGIVDSVTPSIDDDPILVHIDLLPRFANSVPDTVTARVVPSNVFAIPSVQLLYNGPGASLVAGARISEDHSAGTVRLQTSLTALNQIVAAAGRSGVDPTLGILTTLEQATSGRGENALRAGAQLSRIVESLDAAIAPDGTGSTLTALSEAVTGLRDSSPELLGAVHNAVGPMRALAVRQAQLADLLTGATTTLDSVSTGLRNRTDTITDITGRLGPVLEVLAEGGRGFVQMTTSQRIVAEHFNESFNTDTDKLTAKIIVELTPHRPYTRADCPRYGALEGPSCATAPVGGPTIIGPNAAPTAPVRPIELPTAPAATLTDQITAILGAPNPAAAIILGPLLHGNDVKVSPAPAEPTPTEGPR